SQRSKNTWNAPFIRASGGEHVSRYFMVVRACAPSERHAFERGIFRVVLSEFAPLTGVLLTVSLNPQCSHSIQMRADRYYTFHVRVLQLRQVSGSVEGLT